MAYREGEEKVMSKELHGAAVNGDIEVLTNSDDSHSHEYFLMKTPKDNNNILHIAIANERFGFSEEALKKFPQLLSEKNSVGNNPVHIAAAKVGSTDFVRTVCATDTKPLKMENSDGNTPLHVAIIHGNLEIATYIMEKVPHLARVFNGSQEAPLHLLIKLFAHANQDLDQDFSGTVNYSFLELLLNIEPSVACKRDTTGLTPLHRAAWLNTNYVLVVVKLILSKSPSSMEVRDGFWQNILHHLINKIPSLEQGIDLFDKVPGLRDMKNYQDRDGDTPLHLALINKDIIMLMLLAVTDEDLSIKNNDGVSIETLINNKTLDSRREARRRSSARGEGSNYLYVALQNADPEFDDPNNLYGLQKTHNNNNAVHMAIQFYKYSFAKEALSKYPHLMAEENSDGNLPLHIAAQIGDPTFVRELCSSRSRKKYLNKQNSVGNTPLHVALLYNDLDTARILLEKDHDLVRVENDLGETPLHLVLDSYCDGGIEEIERIVYRMTEDKKDDIGTSSKHQEAEKIARKFEEGDKEDITYHPAAWRLVHMIDLMLTIKSSVACWRDKSGLTPLHKAAQLEKSYNLHIIRLIMFHCPQSVEVRDKSGKTILHHLIHRIQDYAEGKRFMNKNPGLRVIRNYQDCEGNTPLLMALTNKDIIMSQLLIDCFNKLNRFIKNKVGVCAATLIRQKDGYEMMITDEDCIAAEHGDLYFLEKRLETGEKNFLSRKDSVGRNLLHKLLLIHGRPFIICDHFVSFIKRLSKNTDMLLQTDRNGDTPFHILAGLAPRNTMVHVANGAPKAWSQRKMLFYKKLRALSVSYMGYYDLPYFNYNYDLKYLENTSLLEGIIKVFDGYVFPDSSHVPWVMKNDKGNTPLHEAIIAKNFQVLPKLAQFFRDAALANNLNEAALINNRKETVCHLLASLTPFSSLSMDDGVLKDIIMSNTRETDHHLDVDVDGLSPLIRAIQAGNIEFASRLCTHRPGLAKVTDPKGQTFWHLLARQPQLLSKWNNDTSFKHEVVWKQLEKKDNNEDTPLHLALTGRHFDLATEFLTHDGSKFEKPLLDIPNKVGDTPGDLIGAFEYLPHEFDKFIWKKDHQMIGTRSIWGISTEKTESYVNTMGVIAALITTITFTAAFTVPGGLNQEKGTPLLIKERAFGVFIISNVLAMCFSMMVLICLLWIMAAGNKRKSVELLDFSIILLLASFYTTLLTFMAGLYATIHPVKPKIANASLVPCCALVLLIHQYLVIKLVIPIGKIILILYLYVSEAFQSAKNWCRQKFVLPIKEYYQGHISPKVRVIIDKIKSSQVNAMRAIRRRHRRPCLPFLNL